jgi:hypothetical protein
MSTAPEGVTAGAEQIADQVRRVAELRRQRDEANTKIAKAREDFFQSIKHLTEEANKLGSECASAETMLKASALALYQKTKETRPTAGVQVKIFKTLDYDPEKADQWTRKMGLARIPDRLDVKAFEKIARATPIDFVEEKQEPRVQISIDLEKVLSKAAGGGEQELP